MASAASFDACITFLDGDAGDVRTTINAEQTGLLVAGSVTTARSPRGAGTRKANAFPVSVEVAPVGPSTAKAIGIGMEEVSHSFDLECSVRKKSLTGKEQIDQVEDMCRALIRRYRGVTDLDFSFDPTVTFVSADAQRTAIDTDPEAAERIRAVTRVTFTFLESRATNA